MNVSAKVDVKHLKKQLAKASTMGTPEQRKDVLTGALFLIVEQAVDNLKALGLWITGNLAGAITSEVQIRNETVVEGRVGTNLVYARIHELGGIIKPKSKKYLHFKGKNGQWAKVKKVQIKARPYLRPAYVSQLTNVVNTLVNGLEAVLRDSIK